MIRVDGDFSQMRAFEQTEVSMDQLLEALAAHREANRLVQEPYWAEGRGGAVGCSIHDFRPGSEDEEDLYEPLFGIPRALPWLEDSIFMNLAWEEARLWPERFVRTIRPGSDLTMVGDHFLHWLLSGEDSPLVPWKEEKHMQRAAMIVKRRMAGDEPSQDEWTAVRDAAAAAAAAASEKIVNSFSLTIAGLRHKRTSRDSIAAQIFAHAPPQAFGATAAAWAASTAVERDDTQDPAAVSRIATYAAEAAWSLWSPEARTSIAVGASGEAWAAWDDARAILSTLSNADDSIFTVDVAGYMWSEAWSTMADRLEQLIWLTGPPPLT